MNRKELVRRIANVMRENDIRKPVSSQKQVFHISDDEGNSKDFVVKKTDKGVLFTYDDVEAVMDTCLAVIGDSLKRHEEVEVSGRYVPKFESGKDLKMCAKMYELSLEERLANYESSESDEEEGDE